MYNQLRIGPESQYRIDKRWKEHSNFWILLSNEREALITKKIDEYWDKTKKWSESEVIQLCPTLCNPIDCSLQAAPSMGFSRQEYRSGLPFPPPGDLPSPGGRRFTLWATRETKKWKTIGTNVENQNALPLFVYKAESILADRGGVGEEWENYCLDCFNYSVSYVSWGDCSKKKCRG